MDRPGTLSSPSVPVADSFELPGSDTKDHNIPLGEIVEEDGLTYTIRHPKQQVDEGVMIVCEIKKGKCACREETACTVLGLTLYRV